MKKGRRKQSRSADLVLMAVVMMLSLWLMSGSMAWGTNNGTLPPFLLLLVAALLMEPVLALARRRRKRKRYLNSDLPRIDCMSGEEFEEYLAVHFRRKGYRVTCTGGSRDNGCDLLLERHGKRTVVQAKRYRGKVGIAAINQAVGARGFYRADHAMAVPSSYFTRDATEQAEANGVELWDRDDLMTIFVSAPARVLWNGRRSKFS